MALPRALSLFLEHPEMYVTKLNSDTVSAFVQGYDAATDGQLLTGLRETLVLKLGYGNNLAWPELLARYATAVRGVDNTISGKAFAEFLRNTLIEHFASTESNGGLQRIRENHAHWVAAQSWS